VKQKSRVQMLVGLLI